MSWSIGAFDNPYPGLDPPEHEQQEQLIGLLHPPRITRALRKVETLLESESTRTRRPPTARGTNEQGIGTLQPRKAFSSTLVAQVRQ